MAGFGSWFGRRVVRADLREGDIVSSSGGSVIRFGEYLDDSRGGRRFWLVASMTQLVVFVGLPPMLVLGLWERSDLGRGDPFRIGLCVVVSAASWWCATVWQGSVRAMARARPAPVRPDEDDPVTDG